MAENPPTEINGGALGGYLNSLNPINMIKGIANAPVPALAKLLTGEIPTRDEQFNALTMGLVPNLHEIATESYRRGEANISHSDMYGGVAAAATLAGLSKVPVLKAATKLVGNRTKVGGTAASAMAEASPEAVDALRSKTTNMDVLKTVQDSVQRVANQKFTDYRAARATLPQTITMDLQPAQDAFQSMLKDFDIERTVKGKLDFSQSRIATNSDAIAAVQKADGVLQNWDKGGTGQLNVNGMDSLKQNLGELMGSDSKADAILGPAREAVLNELNTKIPGYEGMSKSFYQSSELLRDIKRTLKIGGTAADDTQFRTLMNTILKSKDNGIALLDTLRAQTGIDLPGMISGRLMSDSASQHPFSLTGRGGAGLGIGLGGTEIALHYLGMPTWAKQLAAGAIVGANAIDHIVSKPKLMGELLVGIAKAKKSGIPAGLMQGATAASGATQQPTNVPPPPEQ